MIKKIKEWWTSLSARYPGKIIVTFILLFNIVFFLISTFIINRLSLSGTEEMGLFEAAFCTITMILDAGCIQFVVEDIGTAGVAVVIVCLVIIVIGMISFTGAVIGYITNYISGFIDRADSDNRKLYISGHTVILNWNNRASEIVNDLLYCSSKQKVVVLVSDRKAEIKKEIEERLADTVSRENAALRESCCDMGFFRRKFTLARKRFKKRVTVFVRQGDVFSSKQLRDISLEKAKAVIILGDDIRKTICKYEEQRAIDDRSQGNAQTVKTLMQVADITSAEYSDDNQKIIVEITDEWTEDLVDKIIKYKQVDGKCNITPVRINTILGQMLSQFSLMPELNRVYKELFSNKGATFFTREEPFEEDSEFIGAFLAKHRHAIPLTFMKSGDKSYAYYCAGCEKDIDRLSSAGRSDFKVSVNADYRAEEKYVIILGHNSKCGDIMRGYSAFCHEWKDKNSEKKILHIDVIDDAENLKKMNYYNEYPFVRERIEASVYNREKICGAISRLLEKNESGTSILILSDDEAERDETDSMALANLVYVQEIIREQRRKAAEQHKTLPPVDIIVEIIDPKHHDIVSSYSVDNIVISNRYISKMITQIGEKEAIYDFYNDILTYDREDAGEYTSKEIYAKKVSRFFNELPERCTARELVHAVFEATSDKTLSAEKQNLSVVLGCVKENGKAMLFNGDLSEIQVKLESGDKIIVFSNH